MTNGLGGCELQLYEGPMPAMSKVTRRDDAAASVARALSSLLSLSLRMSRGPLDLSLVRDDVLEKLSIAHTAMWLVLQACTTESADTRLFFQSLLLLPSTTAYNLRADVQLMEERGWFVITAIAPQDGVTTLRQAHGADPSASALDPASALRESLSGCGLVVLAEWMGSPEGVLELSQLLTRLLRVVGLVRGDGDDRRNEELLYPFVQNAEDLVWSAARTQFDTDPSRLRDDVVQAWSLRATPPAAPALLPSPAFDEGVPLHEVAHDDVRFTIYRPRQLVVASWAPLLAFVHLSERRHDAPPNSPHPIEVVLRQAEAWLGGGDLDLLGPSDDDDGPIQFEGLLTFVPRVPGVEFDPPQQSFRWVSEVHRAEFKMRAQHAAGGTATSGQLSVFLGNVLVADVALSFPVVFQFDRPPARQPVVSESAGLYRKIFASYSRRDVHVAEGFRELSRVWGDCFVVDLADHRAGDELSPAVERSIRQADVFQLFWSSNSMRSAYVRAEWDYALSLGRPNFVRPTYWEDPLPALPERDLPPTALRDLDFQAVPRFVSHSDSTDLSSIAPIMRSMGLSSVARSSAYTSADDWSVISNPRLAAAKEASSQRVTLSRPPPAPNEAAPPRRRLRLLALGAATLAVCTLLIASIQSASLPLDSSEHAPSSMANAPESAARVPGQPAHAEASAIDVVVTTIPGSAELFRNGELVGKTPVSYVRIGPGETLELRREGYRSATVSRADAKDGHIVVTLQSD